MYISIHELLAVARESEGIQVANGDAILCEKRFARETCYMVEFILLKDNSRFGKKGEYHRYFLTTEKYKEIVQTALEKRISVQRHALVKEGNLHYAPFPVGGRNGKR